MNIIQTCKDFGWNIPTTSLFVPEVQNLGIFTDMMREVQEELQVYNRLKNRLSIPVRILDLHIVRRQSFRKIA